MAKTKTPFPPSPPAAGDKNPRVGDAQAPSVGDTQAPSVGDTQTPAPIGAASLDRIAAAVTAPPEPRPVVTALALQHAPATTRTRPGWCVVMLYVQGEDVVDRRILAGPVEFPAAVAQLRIEVVKQLIAPAQRPEARS